MKNRILLTAVTASLLGLGTAYAHGDRDPGKMFEALDANGDGQLSQNELDDMHAVMAKKRFQGADDNGDGQIDRDEFMAKAQERAERMFDHMDDNDDGVLDADEARPHRGDKADHDHDKKAKHDGHGKKPHFDPMKKMDSNGDGTISRDEWDSAMEKMHKRHDQQDEAE